MTKSKKARKLSRKSRPSRSSEAEETREVGRPRKEFTPEMVAQFEQMCAVQCTEKEICAAFDMNIDTLNARLREHYGHNFSYIFEIKRQSGLTSLRSKQFEAALNGDKTMLVWLGRNWLNQTERQEISFTPDGEGKSPIVHIPSYSDKLPAPAPAATPPAEEKKP